MGEVEAWLILVSRSLGMDSCLGGKKPAFSKLWEELVMLTGGAAF
jgi:hypothetical protein